MHQGSTVFACNILSHCTAMMISYIAAACKAACFCDTGWPQRSRRHISPPIFSHTSLPQSHAYLEHSVFQIAVLDVVLQEQAVHLAVHVLNGYLEAIECTGLWDLDLCTAILNPQDLGHNKWRSK